ncbi:MAG: germination protein YpeB [Clostridia bacterium]|nr:germination protein YpeB [Clostridia bacterium]
MQKSRRPYIRALIFLTVSAIMLICYMTAWRLLTNNIQTKEDHRLTRSLISLTEAVTSLRDSMEALASSSGAETAKSLSAGIKYAAGLTEDAILTFDGERSLLTGLLDCASRCAAFSEYAADRLDEFGSIPTSDAASLNLLIEYITEAERILLLLEHEAIAKDILITSLTNLTASSRLESLFTDLPLIHCDNASSRRLQTGDSSFTRKALPLTRREAEKKAQSLLGSEITLTCSENKLSPVEVYSFWCDNAQVDISKNGGYPIRILRDITSTGTPLEQSILLTRMSDYLAGFGYSGLTPIFSYLTNHIFTAEFIYTEGSLLDYTSRIKISCLADTARVIYLDAASYAANRGAFPQPVLPSDTPIYLLFDGSGSPHYCMLIENRYYDITTDSLIHAPILP